MDERDIYTRYERLRARVAELEAALAYQRQLVEHERRRADALEESARRAWRVSSYGPVVVREHDAPI